jgi:hypothetical protein
MAEHERFCTACGTQKAVAPAAPAQKPLTKEELPAQFRILSPWAYFGLQILYAVPVVGFIFLLIHTFSSGNLNRRSFARSYWCSLLLSLIVMIVLSLAMATGLIASGELEALFGTLS